MTAHADLARRPWAGANREYDLVKEFVIAILVVGALTLGLAVAFGSPDDRSTTMKTWATAAPSDFVATTAQELAGTSGTAGYGQPYNDTPDAAQHVGPLQLQKWAGVRIPINTADDFVIGPLSKMPPDVTTTLALTQWKAASADQQAKWAGDYADAIAAVPDGDYTKAAPGDYGPVPALAASELAAAQGGALDSVIQAQGQFYNTDYTYSLLFLADGTFLEDQARAQNLGGDQWGMMNETGSYPGQSWLWLYTFWYQVKPFSDESTTVGANADAYVWVLMMLLTLGLLLVPFIPGIRSLPRWIPIHRLIWRDYYRTHSRT
ncbi:MAG: hypothetical protein ACHQE5_00020 [Actinomycetes bacterium]